MFDAPMWKVYAAIQFTLLLSLYIVPYFLLYNANDLSLFLYWSIVTILIGILCIAWLSNTRKQHTGEKK